MFRFAIDRGGTFTDIYAICPNGKVIINKLLSVDPKNYDDAPREGIRRILQAELGDKFSAGKTIDSSVIEWIRMGTTVATNALLERKGEPIALVVTKGFKDVLEIGNQARPRIFDLEIKCPEILYSEVIEVEERVVLRQEKCQMEKHNCQVKTGSTGEQLEVWQEVNVEKLGQDLLRIKNKGIKSLAVALVHSFIYPEHEKIVGKLAQELGFTHVSLSSQIMPMVKIVPRGLTSCADAYLTPHIQRYLNGFSAGFTNNLKDVNVLFMQSDGGLTTLKNFSGFRAILSGPAGGVVGYGFTTFDDLGSNDPVIGFDMGGTSTDVSRFNKAYELTFETTTAGITIQAPQLDINTVAAGGGSMLFFRSGLFVVGPESAGAYPGPVCYKNGGPLTVTDANLCLGRILPDYFPKIFGPMKNEPLDKETTMKEFMRLTNEINNFILQSKDTKDKTLLSVEDVAMGYIKVANESMCRPIRSITQGKGYDASKHILACFGGAGGQHACAIARSLGMKTVFIHKYSGILSAFGMALADVVHEETVPCAFKYEQSNYQAIDQRLSDLITKCDEHLTNQGFEKSNMKFETYLNMRYEKTDFGLMTRTLVQVSEKFCSEGDFKESFVKEYQREFGFTIPDRAIIVDDIRVRGIGLSHINDFQTIERGTSLPPIDTKVQCYFDQKGYLKTPVFLLKNLLFGHEIEGPAIIIDPNFTVLVEPDCIAKITQQGNIKIDIQKSEHKTISSELDPIQLSIFSHRFMSIAEQMGRVLQRTSISTNIKERLDFSCALFGADGGLVSNAPHIPVHLGAMGETVKYQIEHNKLKHGDVILSNHPLAGGSHLPDFTVITPVFHKNQENPIFFVASRGHHADIGGLTPGSMPPHSTRLDQEGAAFMSFKLVENGTFQEKQVIEALMAPGKVPGCSGTRTLNDNLSDLRAQVAANQKGIILVSELIEEYTLEIVQCYMNYIQKNAEIAVRDMLKNIAKNSPHHQLVAIDSMDDGTDIKLTVDINGSNGTATFDFTGTGLEVHGNCNTPKAVTYSAIIYCLRCMVGHDIPLNQGCLAPIKVIIPEGTILNASEEAAVIGGNVLTSQRVTDVIFKAFEACAASQGCMNNITFGDETFGYYETVAGGSGATSNAHGKSGVHTHMTNTRITDVEIIERRYPVIINTFTLNAGTGGKGKFNGGNGVIRELLFRKDLVLSVLTERRVFSPYGLNGGKNGRKGINLLKYKNGRLVNLGSKSSVNVKAGDIFHLETPGGGGYGTPETSQV